MDARWKWGWEPASKAPGKRTDLDDCKAFIQGSVKDSGAGFEARKRMVLDHPAFTKVAASHMGWINDMLELYKPERE